MNCDYNHYHSSSTTLGISLLVLDKLLCLFAGFNPLPVDHASKRIVHSYFSYAKFSWWTTAGREAGAVAYQPIASRPLRSSRQNKAVDIQFSILKTYCMRIVKNMHTNRESLYRRFYLTLRSKWYVY